MGPGASNNQKKFPEAIMDKIFEANSSFHEKYNFIFYLSDVFC